MTDHNESSPSRALTVINKVRTDAEKREMLLRKADDRMPDDVWLDVQEVGRSAAGRLAEMLNDPHWDKRSITERTRLIELGLNRAFGASEGSFKRAPKPPEGDTETLIGNSLADLARKAEFPELRMVKSAEVVPIEARRKPNNN